MAVYGKVPSRAACGRRGRGAQHGNLVLPVWRPIDIGLGGSRGGRLFRPRLGEDKLLQRFACLGHLREREKGRTDDSRTGQIGGKLQPLVSAAISALPQMGFQLRNHMTMIIITIVPFIEAVLACMLRSLAVG